MIKLFPSLAMLLVACSVCAQSIPLKETEFTIRKNEKQEFTVSLKAGEALKVRVMQKGIDIGIGIFRQGSEKRLQLFDSPNGEFGPEPILFVSAESAEYRLVIEPLEEDTVSEGRYSIQQISIRPLLARTDTAFAGGSNIDIASPDKIQIADLTNLGMLWGFLKYYHPEVAAGNYNWDAELFRILPGILNAGTAREANRLLEKWIDKLKKPDSCTTCKALPHDSSVKMLPDYGYLLKPGNLPASLTRKIDYVRNNRNQEENYYVSLTDGIGNPVFSSENAYADMIYPDAGYRLLALFRYWNIIQYFYPYKYLIGEDWNAVLPEFIPKFIAAHDAKAYVLVCLELIARIHDSHANIWGNNKILSAYYGKYMCPAQARFVEGKLVITGFYSEEGDIKNQVKPGDIVESIDGHAVDQLVEKDMYLTPGSNRETQLRDMARTIMRGQHDTIQLEINRQGKKRIESIRCVPLSKVNWELDYNPSPKDSSYQVIANNIAYIFPGRYKNAQLPQIEVAFENTRGMIIDMRTYPSQFMPFTFGAYLKPDASPFVKFTDGHVQYPGLFMFTPLLVNGMPNPSYYKGPIVEIVNASSQSQAEYTTMAFQTAPNIMVIGSTTAGADGNISPITLPGNIQTWISGIGVYYPDGGETQRKGIRIDLVVKPTIEGIRQGRDELLEKAIELINEKTGKP